jgi:hypothetical protein
MNNQELTNVSGKDFITCRHICVHTWQASKRCLLPSLLLFTAALIYQEAAQAAVYRCKYSAGKIAYSQLPCPAEQQSDQMRGINSTVRQDKDLCRDARDLGMHTFTEVRGGSEPTEVIDEFGGLNYINPPTLGVINFAASLRYNTDVTTQRVGSMTFARCIEGGFGKLSAGDLPKLDAEGAVLKPELADPESTGAQIP